MICVLILAAAQAATPAPPPPPPVAPPSASDVITAQIHAPPPAARPQGLSGAEAQRVYRVYLDGHGAPPSPVGSSPVGRSLAGPPR